MSVKEINLKFEFVSILAVIFLKMTHFIELCTAVNFFLFDWKGDSFVATKGVILNDFHAKDDNFITKFSVLTSPPVVVK